MRKTFMALAIAAALWSGSVNATTSGTHVIAEHNGTVTENFNAKETWSGGNLAGDPQIGYASSNAYLPVGAVSTGLFGVGDKRATSRIYDALTFNVVGATGDTVTLIDLNLLDVASTQDYSVFSDFYAIASFDDGAGNVTTQTIDFSDSARMSTYRTTNFQLAVKGASQTFAFSLYQVSESDQNMGSNWATTALRMNLAEGISFSSASGFLLSEPWRFSSTVPEPATWAMMISGFGLVGGALRRSSKLSANAA